jgi:hypothetical protein
VPSSFDSPSQHSSELTSKMFRENYSGSMLPLTEPIFIIVALLSSYLALILHRLFFSPIAGFPGPKLAAASGWYEFYYDVLKPGMYIYEIEKMHEKYGSCEVLISPDSPTEIDDCQGQSSASRPPNFRSTIPASTMISMFLEAYARRTNMLSSAKEQGLMVGPTISETLSE